MGWTFNKDVNLSQVLTAIAMLIAVLFAYTDAKQSIAIQEVRITNTEAAVNTLKVDISQALADLRYEVRELRTELRKGKQ